MGETRGACARSILTLSCTMVLSVCGRDAVQANGVMEQCDPWAFDAEACALFLSNECEL